MIYVIRNSQDYGPYDEQTLLGYVNSGKILLCDTARDSSSGEINAVSYFLKKANLKPKISNAGSLKYQLKKIGTELIIPKDSFKKKQWISDKRLLFLAIIGLFPTLIMIFPYWSFGVFYAISLYFASIWGLFFYYLFKTDQVSFKTTISVFFATQVLVFFSWDILGIPSLNPFYIFTKVGFPINLVGYTLGVGVTEEFFKLLPLLLIYRKAKEPLRPQTMVFYGLISGIAFGVFEGVQYQMGVNSELNYTHAFLMNIARLTSLPFLHAIWTGIAGYFIAFAKLYPKYRHSLYLLALLIPSVLHGVYDSLCGTFLIVALIITFGGVILLMTYLKQSVNYQSKLRN